MCEVKILILTERYDFFTVSFYGENESASYKKRAKDFEKETDGSERGRE
jgi:hypothetical protein